MRWIRTARKRGTPQAGLTLIELIVASAILIVLATAALPVARVTVKRQQERELRRALRELRDAIDRYKDAADRNLIQVEVGTEGYPPDLRTLVEGVQLAGAPDRRVRFLRRIPIDPMTGNDDWGLRCVQDRPDAMSWCGENVFDVYSRSTGIALDGSRYSDW
ncbi:MAG: type II secretion system GspH family protein [Firmicutes bacterium]|nr:type II secretion system GspH family protein [Bacillota bacterium]